MLVDGDDVVIGGYDHHADVYKPRVEDRWGEPCDPPIPTPGVYTVHIHDGPRYWINGRRVDRGAVIEAIVGSKTLTDDSDHYRITVVGKGHESTVDAVSRVSGPGVTVVGYDADHWHVDGLFDEGVTLQRPDGKVIAFWSQYPGDELFGRQLRPRLPNYDPRRNPRPNEPQPRDPDAPSSDPTWLLILGGAAYLLLRNRQNG